MTFSKSALLILHAAAIATATLTLSGCQRMFEATSDRVLNYTQGPIADVLAQSSRLIPPFNHRINSPMSGNGHAETWDGRIFILTWGPGGACSSGSRWMARVMRPENITRDGNGHPEFNGSTASDAVQLECSTGEFSANAVAVIPMPGTSVGENPYRSTSSGVADPRGQFETYDLLLVSQQYEPINRMYQRRVRIIVGQPKSGGAFIERTEFLTDRQFLKTTQGSFIPGIEPTLPVDGRLLLFHIGNRIHYSYNPNPLNHEGWSAVKSLHLLYSDRNVDLAGVTLGERYPLASRPLKDGFGQPIDYQYSGAYPWISLDGTELFHTTLTATDGAMRSAVSVIGRWTNWTIRHIDGPINPTLIGSPANNTLRLFFSSPGQTPGMWPIYPKSGSPIPLTRNTPVYPLFGSNTSDYNEVSFEDFVDGNYRIFFRMNELLTSGYPNTQRTPDTSGSFNTGELEGGAAFPIAVQNRPDGTTSANENVGAYGRAIYFPPAGFVRVRNNSSQSVGLKNLGNNLSFQFWVKRLGSLPDGTQLLHREDSISIGLDGNQKVSIRLWTARGPQSFGGHGPGLTSGQWHHVACVVTSTTFKLYLDGKVVFSEAGFFELAQTNSDLLIGPGSKPPAQASSTSIVVMDEVTLSVVERSEEEIARAAHVDPVLIEQSPGAIQGQLPLGLDYKDLRLPADNVSSRAVVDIGRRLFHDTRFSSNRQVSCATCHDSARDFTDGLQRGKGVSGRTLDRNTPTILNRAFSARQMFDGRAASLESQVALPLTHPDEMGLSSLAQALSEVNADLSYRSQFRVAFGVETVAAEHFTQAIAGFQRAQMSGNSKIDQYEAGQTGALSLSQIRGRNLFHGKARCVACHSGSNYSDESFHNIGINDTDPGRERVTHRPQDRGSFKTPSLRNLSKTAPYFHNGHAPTLQAVVEHYVTGGTPVIVNGQDVRDTEMRKLDLNASEQEDLVNFLTGLNGDVTEIYLGAGPTVPNPTPVTTTTTQSPTSDLHLISGLAPTSAFQGEEFEVRCNYNRPAGCAYAAIASGQQCRYIRGENNTQIFGCTSSQLGSIQVSCGLSKGILPECPNVLTPVGTATVTLRSQTAELETSGAMRSADNVGEYSLTADGARDGELQVVLRGGSTKQVTAVEVRSSAGGVWDSDSQTPFWIVKVVSESGAVLSGSDGRVSFLMNSGMRVRLYLPDSAAGDFIRAGVVLTATFQFSDGTRAQSATTISGAVPQPTTTTSSSTTTTTQGAPGSPQFISGSAPTDYSTNAGEYILNCIYDRPLGCVYAQSGNEGCRYVRTTGGTHTFGCSTRTLGVKENKCGLSSYILPTCPNQINVIGTTRIF